MYVPQMFELAKIDTTERNITGHSGKVTCATTLYALNFEEQVIKHRSGHRSDAVRAYKCPSIDLCDNVSNGFQPPKSVCVNKVHK